uniref:Uncharacterized protein n=1 Tax=Chenopodium quinoa TaxID=63459 RepID=A0A803NB28_CHEQI
MEDSMSSTNHKNKSNFSGDGHEVSSEDSGWSSYFDNSIAISNVEDTVTCSGSENSSIFSGAAVLVKKMNMNNDDRVASARSVAKRRKILATYIDPELEDTAISPVCNSEAEDLEKLQIKLQETGVLNILPPVQQGKHDFFSLFQEKQNTSNQTGEVPHSGYIGTDISYAGLKEKGLCLVPVSLLFRVSANPVAANAKEQGHMLWQILYQWRRIAASVIILKRV